MDNKLSSESQGLKIEDQLCFSLYSTSNALTRAYRPLLDALGLTYLQYMVMIVLWEHKSLNVKQLGELLHLDSGTLTPLLKRMAEKGVVTRKRSAEDERVRVIAITDAGEKLHHEAQKIPHKLSCQIDMSLDDARKLKALSDQLLKALL